MKRTTIMLPEELKRRAEERAVLAGISLGELIRRSLSAAVSSPPPRRSEDPLFADAEVFRGPSPANLSREHDDYLYSARERSDSGEER